jgi:hypothetical protein
MLALTTAKRWESHQPLPYFIGFSSKPPQRQPKKQKAHPKRVGLCELLTSLTALRSSTAKQFAMLLLGHALAALFDH